LDNVGHYCRVLSKEEVERLQNDHQTVSEFRREKLEKEADRNWDKFYNRHSVNFFKDRHWTKEEFQELCPDIQWQDSLKILEAGCGVGNLMFPLVDSFPNLFMFACDFSPRAVEFVKGNLKYDSKRCHAFVCDLTKDDSLFEQIGSTSIDVCTLIFVLSAINPDKMASVLVNIHKILKPCGSIIVRDYGLYDHAMLRFARGHKLSENFYVRQDGTRAYYFSEDKLNDLFAQTGFEKISCRYVQKLTENRKELISVQRIFIQGRFKKL